MRACEWVGLCVCVCVIVCVCVRACVCVSPRGCKAVSLEPAQQRPSLCVSVTCWEDVCDGSTVFGAILREIKLFPFPLSLSTRTIFAGPVRRMRAQRESPPCGEVEQELCYLPVEHVGAGRRGQGFPAAAAHS